MSTSERSDWCRRVDAAIAAGRYLEDPALYADHVGQCPTCRTHVDGYTVFQACLDRARIEAGADAEALGRDTSVVSRAFSRYRVARQIRGAAFGLAALVAVAASLWFVARGPASSGRADLSAARDSDAADADADEGSARLDPLDASRRAERLLAAVTRPDRVIEPMRLREDPALRRRFEAALSDAAPVVRRTALIVLTGANLGPNGTSIEAQLDAFQPSLEAPVQVAAAGDPRRAITDSLEAARVSMLVSMLSAAENAALRGDARVSSAQLVRLLGDPSDQVRAAALAALEGDAGYQPGVEVLELLRSDPVADVRMMAAHCLVTRRGDAGRATLLALFRERRDDALERTAASLVAKAPGAAEVARARAEDAAVPLDLRLTWALMLWRVDGSRLDSLIAEGLAATDGDAVYRLVALAREANWVDLRPALQARWRAVTGPMRRHVGGLLVTWDAASGDAVRYELAFEILAAHASPTDAVGMRHAAEPLLAHPDPSVAARARAILGAGGDPK